jgi:DNA-binding NarL/FixJ family response regulator
MTEDRRSTRASETAWQTPELILPSTVYTLTLNGYSNKEIAKQLNTTPNSIRHVLDQLRNDLGPLLRDNEAA